jgi:hypothetical protein
MKTPMCALREVFLPVGASLGGFCLLNLCWNVPFPDIALIRVVPAQVGVYLLGGLLALWLLGRSMRHGTLTARDIGLDGPARPRRLLVGLAMTIALVAVTFTTQPLEGTPRASDFYFWFLFLMPATLAELLVFVCLGFCLPRRWLRDRGLQPTWAAFGAGLFASVAFGLYHYTHEQRWHPFALQLIPVMGLGLACFAVTRSLHMTFLLHNSVAAAGFTAEQHRHLPILEAMNPGAYYNVETIAMLLTTFAVPCLLLHAVRNTPLRLGTALRSGAA